MVVPLSQILLEGFCQKDILLEQQDLHNVPNLCGSCAGLQIKDR